MTWHLHRWGPWVTFERIEWTKQSNNRIWFQHFQNRICGVCGKTKIRSVKS